MKKVKKSDGGYSLLEIVIVVSVIAILVAILVPTFVNVIGKANDVSIKASIKNAHTAYVTENVEKSIGGEALVFVYGKQYFILNSDGEYVELDETLKDAVNGTPAYEKGKCRIYDWSESPLVCLLAYEAYEASQESAAAIEDCFFKVADKYYTCSGITVTEITDSAQIAALKEQISLSGLHSYDWTSTDITVYHP